MGFSKKQGNKYQPSSDRIKIALKKLNIQSDDSIIDIGCGKGKAMYMMSKFPFKKIDGYDLSPQMVDIANGNFRHINKNDVCTSFCADAATYTDYSKYNYFYAFNPVPGDVFYRLMNNIENNIKDNPRECFFIYLNPVYEKYFEDSDEWNEDLKMKAILKWNHVYVYKHIREK